MYSLFRTQVLYLIGCDADAVSLLLQRSYPYKVHRRSLFSAIHTTGVWDLNNTYLANDHTQPVKGFIRPDSVHARVIYTVPGAMAYKQN